LSNAILLEKIARNNELLEISQAKLREENIRLRGHNKPQFQFENIIGKSPSMRNALILVSKFAAHDSPVLITGDTGTGKELMKAIHYATAAQTL
jgi:transcriptional regulator with PAS, ATPase and Fis domain